MFGDLILDLFFFFFGGGGCSCWTQLSDQRTDKPLGSFLGSLI